MDKIFHSTFDFFTHALPGFCVIVALLVLNPNLMTVEDFISNANQIKTGGGIFLLIIGYVLGFAIHPLGRLLYKKVGFRIWKEKIQNNIDLFLPDKYIMIREFSPSNFKYIETWNMFCAMAHNFAIASLVLLVTSIIKIITQPLESYAPWIVIMLLSIICFFIFLHRAVRFSIWAAHDLNASVQRLKFVERAAKLDKDKKE